MGYTLAYLPPNGFAGRRQLRAVQVSGTASLVTSQAEIAHAIGLCREQFEWLQDSRMFNNFSDPNIADRQVFFRIDPIEALWNDNRVRMLWRTIVTFTPDGKHATELAPDKSRRPDALRTLSTGQAAPSCSRPGPSSCPTGE